MQSWRRNQAILRWAQAALAEVAAAFPWLVWCYAVSGLPDWPSLLPGPWLLLLTYLSSALWELPNRSWMRRMRAVAMLIGVTGAYLLAYAAAPQPQRPASPLDLDGLLGAMPTLLFVWYQGAYRATAGFEFGKIFAWFTQRTLLVAVGLILATLAGAAASPAVLPLLYWSLFLFFGAGLPLLLATRAHSRRAAEAEAGGDAEKGGSLWRALNWIVVALLGATLLLSRLLSVQRLIAVGTAVIDMVSRPANWLFDVAMLIVVRWLWMVHVLIMLLAGLAQRVLHNAKGERPARNAAPALPDGLPTSRALIDWLPYAKGVLIAGMVVAALLLLYRLSRNRRRDAEELDEERISLGFWQALWSDLRHMLSSQQRPQKEANHATAAADSDESDPRWLFRLLQAWGASIGRRRRPAETPHQYGLALIALQPQSERAVEAVTAVYHAARYSASKPEPAAVDAAREAMRQLQQG